MQPTRKWLGVATACFAAIFLWQLCSRGQQPAVEKNKDGAASNRLEFEVVQSFDARYLGDTPGHMGRAGGLERRRPRISLGDPVYRGQQQIGAVTGLTWNRTNGSLDIEFDPVERNRICVGEMVWLALDGSATPPEPSPAR